jgi:hypothetical protein
MDTPLLMLVNVILWSTGVSAAMLALLLSLDCLESWRARHAGRQAEETRCASAIHAA